VKESPNKVKAILPNPFRMAATIHTIKCLLLNCRTHHLSNYKSVSPRITSS
jgi:hypothetical protein